MAAHADLRWLGEAGCDDVSSVGGKVASLSRLASRYRVPPGFCLTTNALEAWSDDGPAGMPLDRAVHALARAYQRLAEHCGSPDPRVAVRSSAVDEDGRGASFAGQYETFLNICGVEAIVDAVARCRASLSSARVLEYRRKSGLAGGASLAVLVQQLVPADVSAVMFTANPVTRCRDEIVINASWGLGESIVGGTVTPDSYVVHKHDLSVRARHLSDKVRMTVPVPGGTREVEVPRLLRARAVLDDMQLVEMARLGVSLEAAHGQPVDVECAFHLGSLYVLQCRPITTLGTQE